MVKKIILAQPRGFCAGVDRAIEIVEESLNLYEKPVYVRHAIVHNSHVVGDLEKKGAIFIESLENIPENSLVIFSAHGIPPEVIKEAEKRNLKFIDATCPLVTKIHLEAKRYHNEGYSIILIGHKNHQEVLGTMGYAPMTLVETKEDVKKLKIKNEKIICLTQTTLSLDDTKGILKAIKQKYPQLETPKKEDICYATQNRQNAVKELSKKTDLILVIGDKESSNSNRLVETAVNNHNKERSLFPITVNNGCSSFLIKNKDSIKEEWLNSEIIGLTSGASVPESLIQDTINYFKKFNPNLKVEILGNVEEDVKFLMPPQLEN